MQPKHSVGVVYDIEDAATKYLQDLHDPARGRFVVGLTPGGRNLAQLGTDIGTALGKSTDVAGNGRNAQEKWGWLLCGAAAEETTHLIVLRAGKLDRRRWELLVELSALTNSQLWLVVQASGLSRSQREGIRDWGMKEYSYEAFKCLSGSWPQTKAASAAPPSSSFPVVPEDDFAGFRASARMDLTDQDFAKVDAVFLETKRATDSWIRSSPSTAKDAVAEWLLSLIDSSQLVDEAQTRIRAAQVAFFLAGIHVKVDVRRLTVAWTTPNPTAVDAVSLAQALRAYVNTDYAAIGVLAGLGASPTEIAAIKVADLSDGAETCTISAKALEIVSACRSILQAHRLTRLFEGATDTSWLFIPGSFGEAVDGAVSIRSVRRHIGQATSDTRLLITPRDGFRGRQDPIQLARNLGLVWPTL